MKESSGLTQIVVRIRQSLFENRFFFFFGRVNYVEDTVLCLNTEAAALSRDHCVIQCTSCALMSEECCSNIEELRGDSARENI